MGETVIKNWDNEEIGKLKLSADIFGLETRQDILHRVVQWQLSKARLGCHKTKQRNEVSGSTRKVYRQKGTGQARHGSIKAPIYVGGGIVFGPVVRSHEYSLNKKIKTLGLKIALSLKMNENSIIILDSMELDSYKTTKFNDKLKKLGVQSVLIVDNELNQNLISSSANLANVNLLPIVGLNVYDILRHKTLIISKDAISALEKRLSHVK